MDGRTDRYIDRQGVYKLQYTTFVKNSVYRGCDEDCKYAVLGVVFGGSTVFKYVS
jgi:hypothetical protein